MQQKEFSNQNKELTDWMRRFYNHKVKQTCKGNYEYDRWFSSKNKRRQYKFSVQSSLFHLNGISFKNCLEVGCGPGTWTKLLLKKYPKTKFTCIDLSKEMLEQFKQNVKNTNIKTKTTSFLDYETNQKFDFIFFSRAIEYIPNKPKVIEKVYKFMAPGAKAILITSPPHPKTLAIKKLFGKKINPNHLGRISVKRMNFLLKKQGFANIEFYPILFTDFFLVPTSLLFRTLHRKKWGLLSKMFASGYLVKFEKPKNETK